MSLYENNIQALLPINPLLASRIFAVTENKQFEVFQGKDSVDINLLDLSNQLFMYANPVNDIIALSEHKKDQERYPYRYFFGIANGIYLKMALKAPALKRVLLVEPNIELLYIVFNLIDFSEEIRTKKLIIESADELDFTVAFNYLNDDEGKLFAKLFDLETASNYYDTAYADEYAKVISKMTQALSHVIMGHGNSAIDSLMGIEHHFVNLPQMIEGPKFAKLIGKHMGETAIVVSTGPSLTKQLPLLKKIQDHVTIISVDASFPILEKHGIKPDYVTVLERVPETGKFFENNSLEFQKDVKFICVSIIHEAVKNAIREGDLYLEMRPHGYTQFFGLDDFGYLGTGMSAANLAHELAVILDYKNCILIGQDLAFGDDDTSHAADHTFTVNEESTEGHDIFTTRYGGGGEIRTTYYWELFRNHFESLIKQTSSFFTTINSTEGGSRIEGSTEMSFSDAVEKYVDMGLHKKSIKAERPTKSEIKAYTEKMIEKTNFILKEAVEKQELIEKTFIEVQETSENLVKLTQENRLEEIDFDWLQELSDKIDVIKNFTHDSVFNLMFFDTIQSYMVQMELDFAVLHVSKAETDIEKKSKLIDWVMKHRYWLFALAGGIDAQRLTMIKAIETWPKELQDQLTIPEKHEIPYSQEKYEKLKVQAEKEQKEREKEAQESLDKVTERIAPTE